MTESILQQLSQPFHPSRIVWKPGSLTGDKKKAMAMAYADVRAYQNRLDEVCGMDWSLAYTPWGDRIICHLTISGVTRSSTGEPDSASERSEIAGTSAEAQAFKRACAMFGLGRYLYELPSAWAEYDAESKKFTEQAKARLNGIITQHYQRFLDGRGEPSNGESWDGLPNATESDKQLTILFDEAGHELYGEQWPIVREKNINRITNNKPAQLTSRHIQTLINGMNELKKRRQPA